MRIFVFTVVRALLTNKLRPSRMRRLLWKNRGIMASEMTISWLILSVPQILAKEHIYS
jgi:hypothetical protein